MPDSTPHGSTAVRAATPARQPFHYPLTRPFVEPDWRRVPGFRDVTQAEWESALWQRKHTLKNLKELKAALGSFLPDALAASIERDQKERATMSLLVPPQMLNTMRVEDLWNDPIRRYMLPAFEDRDPDWPSHPRSQRDSLHEADMWVVEGLTHRYPTKVLAELLSTCPQYCGHCTRMDLVGNDVPQVEKHKFTLQQKDRYTKILDYLRATPQVRDVVVSGGDIANLPITVLENFVSRLLDIANIMPYYFYMCDMIPSSEHWRLAVHEAQRLQHDLMGYLPGFATPRIVCDVPLVGKRWVNQLTDYDREKGISYWTKNYRTALEADDAGALTRRYEYYDPIYTLPESGQAHWRAFRARA